MLQLTIFLPSCRGYRMSLTSVVEQVHVYVHTPIYTTRHILQTMYDNYTVLVSQKIFILYSQSNQKVSGATT